MDKSRFILYLDQKALIDELSDKQAGQLIKAIYDYVTNQTIPDLEPITKMAFVSIKTTLDRDNEKYIAKCNKNKESVEKRWSKDDTNVYERINKNTNVSKKIRTYKNDTSIDSDSDRDRDRDKELHKSNLKKEIVKEKKKYGEYGNVTLSDVEYNKLATDYPIAELITILDEAKEQHGYKYKSDYLAIKNWVIKEYESRHKNVSTPGNNVRTDIVVNYSDSINQPLSSDELEALKEFRQ